MTVGHVAGAAHVQLWRVDENGRMCGTETDPDSIADGTTTHAHLVKGLISFDLQDADRTKVDFRHGDGVVGSMYFGASQAPTGTLSLETIDALLRTMSEGGLIDTTTVSGWSIFGANSEKAGVNTLGLCLSRQWQSRDTGTDGDMKWLNEIYKLQLSLKDPAAQYQSAAEAQIAVTALAQSRFPNGIPFGANQGWYDNKTKALRLLTDYPLGFTTYIADGVATTFTLGYKPESIVVTAATAPNFMGIQNAEVAPSSMVSATGVVTLAAAGSASDFVSMMYAVLDEGFTAP